ncbi:alpha/beta hydrolase [Ruminiclostridium herbifermentans]|uniref:Alpha/beta hydrolase n=1 Tax=Ruminiclostridium herbifermentans TaxID=2488810 RepID=A0A4U7JB03_9FIRM|nr:alpha/beta hydrolase [Ruminiclostridium herbifermentans]QNU67866.1 alpha/beta hydrolase [Ruminiclostridium herbifermentans]
MSYAEEYPQFVDSKEPLNSLQEKDWAIYGQCSATYTFLYALPDPNRKDYFAKPYGDDPLQRLDIHRLRKPNNKKRPVIFFIHGGGWTTEDKSNTRFYALEWIKRGYAVVSVNYRLAPNIKHPYQIDDCALALKWVIDNIEDYGGDPEEIAIIGHSAGAHLTALLVSDRKWHDKYDIDIKKVKCWIPVSGIYDFSLRENYFHPLIESSILAMLNDEDKKDCSPISHITGKEPPCLILHGGDDWLVPRSNSINLYNKLIQKGAKNARLEIVKGYWHCNMMLGYDKEGHKPAEIINEYLAETFAGKM